MKQESHSSSSSSISSSSPTVSEIQTREREDFQDRGVIAQHLLPGRLHHLQ